MKAMGTKPLFEGSKNLVRPVHVPDYKESPRKAGALLPRRADLVDLGLECLARLEGDDVRCRDLDLLLGGLIGYGPGSSGLLLELAEAGDLDDVPVDEGALDGGDDGIDGSRAQLCSLGLPLLV